MIASIEPSTDGRLSYHPCRAVLKSGETIDRLLCTRDTRGFHAGVWIHPDDVESVEASPSRLPARFANQLYSAGESGMGYILWTAELVDGREIVFICGWIVDFPDYPEGVTGTDIVRVRPHVGRERAFVGDFRNSAAFRECFFVPHSSASSKV